MDLIPVTALTLLFATTVFAAPLQVEIRSRYERFEPNPSAVIGVMKAKGDDVLTAPTVTTRSGQTVIVEIIREVPVPGAPADGNTVNTGITLEVLPVVKNKQITLTGKSVVRHQLTQKDAQPLNAISFSTRETFFSGKTQDGEEMTISVGNSLRDKSRIVLTVRLVEPTGAPAK